MSWSSRSRKKKEAFFAFILSQVNCFKISVLSQCIVYWIHFQNIHTFTCQITLLHTLFCFFKKPSKAYSLYLHFSLTECKTSQKSSYIIIKYSREHKCMYETTYKIKTKRSRRPYLQILWQIPKWAHISNC